MSKEKYGLGPRPRDFFGPEDWDGVTPHEEIEADIKNDQKEWDEKFQKLSGWQRFWHSLLIPREP